MAKLEPAPGIRDPRLDHLPPIKLVGGELVLPKVARRSHKEAVAYFLSKHPLGFQDESLLRGEIDHRRKAASLYGRLLGDGQGRALLDQESHAEAASRIVDVFQATEIPSLFEKLAVRDGVRDTAAAARFLDAVLALVEAPNAATFDSLVEAVDRLPAKAGKARVLTWPIVTLLPFLADPLRFIVVKPEMTKVAAERLFFDIGYDSHPNWYTYERVLGFAGYLRDSLKEYGSKDYIDVHSFIWVTAGEPLTTSKAVSRVARRA